MNHNQSPATGDSAIDQEIQAKGKCSAENLGFDGLRASQ